MAILVSMNGGDSDDVFLIAPVGNRTFPVPVVLRTDDGSTVDATLEILPAGAPAELDASSIEVGPAETTVRIHATSQSSTRGDTVLQVLVGGSVAATRRLTAIADLRFHFHGRFEARFATGSDPYNEPRGNSDPQAVRRDPADPNSQPWGWTWALEGEPDFVPADSVPGTIDKPVGRVIRFHNPAALRPRVPPIGVEIVAVSGTLATGAREEFTTGDPIIGQPVELGPNSYFAGNRPPRPGDPTPVEDYDDAREPIANFEFHIGAAFSGKSKTAADRPISPQDPAIPSIVMLTPDERTRFGILPLDEFNTKRRDALLADYNALSAADRTGTAAGRNLAIRIAFLGGDQQAGIRPSVRFRRTLTAGYNAKQPFSGLINEDIDLMPDFSPAMSYLAGFDAFRFSADFFNFHSDELCGQTYGYIAPAASAPAPPAPTPLALGAAAVPVSRLQPPPDEDDGDEEAG